MRKPGTQPHTSGGQQRAGGVQKATIEPKQDMRGRNQEHAGPAGERDVQERTIGSAGDADHGEIGVSAAEDEAADVDDAHERVTEEGDAIDASGADDTDEDEPVEAGAADDGEALPPGSVDLV